MRNSYNVSTFMILSNRNLFRVFPPDYPQTDISLQGRLIFRWDTEYLGPDLPLNVVLQCELL